MGTLRLCTIFALFLGVRSLSCDCDYQNRDKYCGPPPTCPSSSTLVLDPCGCCQICSKIEGEQCGGPWKIYGRCSPGLECHTSSIIDFLGAGGIFGNHIEPKGICQKPGEVLQKTQPCYVALQSYQNPKLTSGHRRRRQVPVNAQDIYSTSTFPETTSQISETSGSKLINMLKTTSSLPTVSSNQYHRTIGFTDVDTSTSTHMTTEDVNISYTTETELPISKTGAVTGESSTVGVSSKMISSISTMSAEHPTTDITSTHSKTTTTVSTDITTSKPTTTHCPLKPRCTPEGWFAPLQCDPCVGECWCVTIYGSEIINTRTHGRARC